MEVAQISTNTNVDKSACSEMLLRNKKEQTTDRYRMNYSQNQDPERKKPYKTGYVQYNPFMQVLEQAKHPLF